MGAALLQGVAPERFRRAGAPIETMTRTSPRLRWRERALVKRLPVDVAGWPDIGAIAGLGAAPKAEGKPSRRRTPVRYWWSRLLRRLSRPA
jgi:hypothetical protein